MRGPDFRCAAACAAAATVPRARGKGIRGKQNGVSAERAADPASTEWRYGFTAAVHAASVLNPCFLYPLFLHSAALLGVMDVPDFVPEPTLLDPPPVVGPEALPPVELPEPILLSD